MTLGDRIKVVCPSKYQIVKPRYAYGKHGLGKILPENSDAHLEIELLGINDEKLSEDYIDDL
jgi:FKBP-type peptidyl-prolyl cis-trans isomerase